MNDACDRRVHPDVLAVFRRFALALLLGGAGLGVAGCGATRYSARPHRFESPVNVAQETHRIAQRMSQGGANRVFADPATGTIVTPWRMVGSTATVTLWPPGERHGWRVQRHRIVVRPNGWASSVSVELDKFDCRAGAFTWTELELRGDCERIDEMTETELQELDRYGASLRG
jgi:hypothetical protein